MKKFITIFLAFVLFAVLGFFMIGFQNSVPTTLTPEAQATFDNQSKAMEITYVGLDMILYIFMAALFIVVAIFLWKSSNFRRY